MFTDVGKAERLYWQFWRNITATVNSRWINCR